MRPTLYWLEMILWKGTDQSTQFEIIKFSSKKPDYSQLTGREGKKKQGQNVLYLQKIHHNDEIEKCYRQTDWIPYLLTDAGLLVLAVLVRFY